MDSQLSQAFQREIPEIVGKVVESLAQMLDIALSVNVTDMELTPLDEFYAACGAGAVCGRSPFVRKANGIGGILVPHNLAHQLSCAAMSADPPTNDDDFDYETVGHEAMSEIFNLVVGKWNECSSPDYRLGSTIEERSIGYHSTENRFPEEAGVYPAVVSFPVTLNDSQGSLAFFAPVGAVVGRDVASFIPPTEFVKDVALAAENVVPVAGHTASNENSADGNHAYDGPVKPVVFLDYTGDILTWIRNQAKRADHSVSLTETLELDNDSRSPAATILVGVDSEVIKKLEATSFVEIRNRENA